jgi:D-glycerate 3-kinase
MEQSRVNDFINDNTLSGDFRKSIDEHYIKLGEQIAAHQNSANNPYFVAINGSQGSGKSTLAHFLKAYLEDKHSLIVAVMSLDDFYYGTVDRQMLAQDVHPMLQTRGVPGTHNTALIKSVFNQFKDHQLPVTVPRFNKATDNPYPETQWTNYIQRVDVVIFEGWCWGVEAQPAQHLSEPVNELENSQDPDATWRNYVNLQLSLHYQPLYHYMHTWIMLKAPSFEQVYAWRLEQEQKLHASTQHSDNHGVMNKQQIHDFIQYYQRLTEHALQSLPGNCDHVFELDEQRRVLNHKVKHADA